MTCWSKIAFQVRAAESFEAVAHGNECGVHSFALDNWAGGDGIGEPPVAQIEIEMPLLGYPGVDKRGEEWIECAARLIGAILAGGCLLGRDAVVVADILLRQVFSADLRIERDPWGR